MIMTIIMITDYDLDNIENGNDNLELMNEKYVSDDQESGFR